MQHGGFWRNSLEWTTYIIAVVLGVSAFAAIRLAMLIQDVLGDDPILERCIFW